MHRTKDVSIIQLDDMVSARANNCGSNATDEAKIVELGVKR